MKYREIKTPKGTKLLLGKDMSQNESLVKEYQDKNTFILHTIAPGSPFCVIVDKPKLGDKKFAAIATAKYSQDWRDNKGNVKVHIFTGKDVSKKKGLAIGTFNVKNSKTIKVKKKDILRFGK